MRGFYEWNPTKAARNLSLHKVPMTASRRFEWDTAIERIDARHPYGEVRCTALGFIGSRMHVMVFTRRGVKIRVISLRKANIREVTFYERF
ncbi:BrnT family toxin [Xanthobacter sp. V3C-3]|uniref:BrnT family toxin n=1 Tax=Xanthobacter lutulentifluminis TaxID=3119935 RepID=UPI00372AF72D